MNILLFIAIGLVGQLAHWLKKWTRGEIECNLITYIKTNPKHTVGAILTTCVTIFGLLSSGSVDITTQTLALAFFAGYGSDSAINKGE